MPLGRTSFIDSVTRVISLCEDLALTGGFLSYAGVTSVGMVVVTSTGSVIPSFSTGGGFQFQVGGRPFCMEATTTGEIYVGGQFTAFNNKTTPTFIRIDRFGNKLTPDIGTFPGYGANNSVQEMKIDRLGRILIRGGSITAYGTYSVSSVARLNPDSLSVDTTFNTGSGMTFNTSAHGSFDFDRSGRIIFTGDIATYNGTSVPRICRVNDNGSLDTTFNVGTGFNRLTIGSLVQDDGKIVVWGYFGTFNGATASGIVRLNQDGSVDSSFNTGTGFGGGHFLFSYVTSCAIDNLGRILAAGLFHYYNGYPVSNLARLNPDGSLDLTFTLGTNALSERGSLKLL
jgi:uncharacterized delta-60 repeat protein